MCVSSEQRDAIRVKTAPEVAASVVVDILLDFSARWEVDASAAVHAFRPEPYIHLQSELARLLESGELPIHKINQLLDVLCESPKARPNSSGKGEGCAVAEASAVTLRGPDTLRAAAGELQCPDTQAAAGHLHDAGQP